MRLWESNSLAKTYHLRSAGTGQSPVTTQRIEITGSSVNLCVPGGSGFRKQPQRTQGAQGKVIRLPT